MAQTSWEDRVALSLGFLFTVRHLGCIGRYSNMHFLPQTFLLPIIMRVSKTIIRFDTFCCRHQALHHEGRGVCLFVCLFVCLSPSHVIVYIRGSTRWIHLLEISTHTHTQNTQSPRGLVRLTVEWFLRRENHRWLGWNTDYKYHPKDSQFRWRVKWRLKVFALYELWVTQPL